MAKIVTFHPPSDKESTESPLKSLSSKFSSLDQFTKLLIITVILVVPIGFYYSVNKQTNISSNAVAPDQLEAEGGVLGGNAKVVSDSNASGGQTILFASNSPTPTITPTQTPSGGALVIRGYGAHALDNLPTNKYVVSSTGSGTGAGTFGGALAWLNAGNQGTVSFSVSGTIDLGNKINHVDGKSNFLIDGRGQSITFIGGPLWFEGSHHFAVVNVRHRGGLAQSQDNDDFTNAGGAHDFAYVNVSTSGAGDEGLSTTRSSYNYTYQDVLWGPGVVDHNYGSLNSADNVSIIRPTFIGKEYRNPQCESGLYDVTNPVVVGLSPTTSYAYSIFNSAKVNSINGYFQDVTDPVTKDASVQLYHFGSVLVNSGSMPASIGTKHAVESYAQVTPMTAAAAASYAKTYSGALPHDAFDTTILSQIK